MLNGVTQLCITKLDVLDSFEEIQVATQYRTGGEVTADVPYDMHLADITPVYTAMKGWNTSLDSYTEFAAMPDATREYISKLQTLLGTRISMVSTGPERHKLFLL
jgi:adenylosuccinate synthase